jgi:enoyl-[acyl-carrier protein] reductase III
MIDLTGKVALVTGGSRGIGRAIALKLAEAGADVVLNFVAARGAADRTAEQIAALGRRVAEVQADVSEPDDIAAMLDWVRETFGRLDILVSNAADGASGSLLEATPERFSTAMNTNVRALILLVQAALPLLESSERRAKVVAISSLGADAAVPGYGLLGASKAALESTVRHMAVELGDRGVNFNAVQAGLVDTDATRGVAEHEQLLQSQTNRQMTGDRRLAPDDIADAVLFLASPLSDLIQGQTLTVDGGAAVRV